MLSRLHSRAGIQGFLKCIAQNQVPAACVTTNSLPQTTSSKRDLINFPRVQQLECSPETKFGFIPKAWFDFLYPKTGVTGPYMLMCGTLTYMFSKEILVINAEFMGVISTILAMYIVHKKYGYKIRETLDGYFVQDGKDLNQQQIIEKEYLKDQIHDSKIYHQQAQGVLQYLPDAKRENIYLQMEAVYRNRLQEAYKRVKKQLDYHVEKSEVEQRMLQKNMVHWVIKNVEESLTPQLKQSALKQCIADLKTLATKA